MLSFFAILGGAFIFCGLYVVINYKISTVVEQRFKEYYHNQVKADIQDFYGEMEIYTSILENRIQKFKLLIQQQETNLKKWSEILDNVKGSKKFKEALSNIHTEISTKIQLEDQKIIEKTENLKSNILNKTSKKLKNLPAIDAPPNQITSPANDIVAYSPSDELLNDMLTQEYTQTNNVIPQNNTQKKRTWDDIPSSGADFLADLNKLKKQNVINQKQVNTYQEEIATPATMNQNEEMEEPPSEIINFLGRLGRSISGKSNLPTSNTKISVSQEYKQATNTNFSKLLEKKTPDVLSKMITNEVSIEKNTNQMYTSKQDTVSLSQEALETITKQTEKHKIVLSSDDIALFLDDLNNQKKRPDALRVLLQHGFSLEELADMGNIPYSALQTTQKIYGLSL